MAKTVTKFQDAYVDRFIQTKMKQYYLPRNMIVKIMDRSWPTLNILNPRDREYIDSALAVNAISYHNGRQ